MPNVTVTAVDTATAMDEIWDQLGPDAMIVSTKKQHGKIVMEATTETASTATEPPQPVANLQLRRRMHHARQYLE